jgi:hypothetical protein
MLKSLLEKQGEEEFLDIHIEHVKYVGEVKATRLLHFVKSKLAKKKQ